MDLQPIFDLVHICHLKGIKHAVISPGSRNAALTIAFARHPEIKCFSVPDERSAAFMGLGMSLKTGLPTVLICTSGSAALNYAPAVAEAYFNQIPLLILSADRPPEWIGQRDGQTIYQKNMFGRHVKKSFEFPTLDDQPNSAVKGQLMVNEAISTALSNEAGPVHINIPFREPFYPDKDCKYTFNDQVKLVETEVSLPSAITESLAELKNFSKVLIVVGQHPNDSAISKVLTELSRVYHIPIVADVISNAYDVHQVITTQDVFLKNIRSEDLQPDLLITIGLSVISKNLKLFLRNHNPSAHWHVREEEMAPDTYLSLSRHITSDAEKFLQSMAAKVATNKNQSSFYQKWQNINQVTLDHIEGFKSDKFSDFDGYKRILKALPKSCDLHLANSMAVRYANIIGLSADQNIEVYCNRGTSGIDGSNSTAIGTAITGQRQTFLLTGDMAFLYDRNAFWHNHLPDNLSIVIFNNHGGGIFRMIDGPSQQPELEEYFETRQQKDAQWLAKEFAFDYHSCSHMDELEHLLPEFTKAGRRKILEIFTIAEESKQVFKELFRKLPK